MIFHKPYYAISDNIRAAATFITWAYHTSNVLIFIIRLFMQNIE